MLGGAERSIIEQFSQVFLAAARKMFPRGAMALDKNIVLMTRMFLYDGHANSRMPVVLNI